jgi:flagellar motor switch protein FliN/FliY
MGDGSLSQEEIDALLMGVSPEEKEMTKKKQPKSKKVKQPSLKEVLDKIDSEDPPVNIPQPETLGQTGALDKVQLTITVVLGETYIKLEDLQKVGEGSILVLDKLAGEEVEIRANNIPIALGEVLVVDENFGVRVTERISLEKQKELLIKGSRKLPVSIMEI